MSFTEEESILEGTNNQHLKLSSQLCFVLYTLTNKLIRTYRPLLDQVNLTYPQYLVMLALWEQDGGSLKELSQKLYLDSGTLTPILKRLEGKGYLKRERRQDDERVRVIKLTPLGRDLEKQAEQIPKDFLCQLGGPSEIVETLRQTCAEALEQFDSTSPS